MEINPKDIQIIEQDLIEYSQYVKPVTDDKSLKIAADNLKAIKIKINEIEDKRKELVKPINDTVKKINDIFRPFTTKATEIKTTLEQNILTFQRAEMKRKEGEERKWREEQIKKMEEEALENGDENIIDKAIQIEQAPVELSNTVKSGWATTTIKENWTYKIINPDEVDRQYCSPDHAKIMASIKSGSREIKGLKIYDKGTVVSNTRNY